MDPGEGTKNNGYWKTKKMHKEMHKGMYRTNKAKDYMAGMEK